MLLCVRTSLVGYQFNQQFEHFHQPGSLTPCLQQLMLLCNLLQGAWSTFVIVCLQPWNHVEYRSLTHYNSHSPQLPTLSSALNVISLNPCPAWLSIMKLCTPWPASLTWGLLDLGESSPLEIDFKNTLNLCPIIDGLVRVHSSSNTRSLGNPLAPSNSLPPNVTTPVIG